MFMSPDLMIGKNQLSCFDKGNVPNYRAPW